MALLPRQSVGVQETHLYQDYTTNLSVFLVILTVITAVSMVMRIWSRNIMNLRLERDDWTFLAGSVLAEGSFVVMCLYSFKAGLGKHWVALTPAQKILFPKLNYAYNILNVASFPLIKISILLLYLRIFVSARLFRRFCWAGIIFISCMCTANTLVAIFACTPIRSFYDMSVKGKCIQTVPWYWSTAVMNVVTDIYLLILPMPSVWRLQTTLRRKIAISALFMLGSLTFVVSIIRIVYYLDYTVDDPSYSFLASAYASPGEVCLGTVVACAPTWRPVWTYSSNMTLSLFRRLSNSSSSSSSNNSERMNLAQSHSHARSVAMGDNDTSNRGMREKTDIEASRHSSTTILEEDDSMYEKGPRKVPSTTAINTNSRSSQGLIHYEATTSHSK